MQTAHYDAPLFFDSGGVAGPIARAGNFTNAKSAHRDVLVVDPVNQVVHLLPQCQRYRHSTTTVASNIATSVQGQVVQLIATVSGQPNLTPVGTVSFFDGASPIGSGTLVNGIATFATAQLGVGDHYPSPRSSTGSSQYQVSNSQPITQTVIPQRAGEQPGDRRPDLQYQEILRRLAIPGDKVSAKLVIADHGLTSCRLGGPGCGQAVCSSSNGIIDGSSIQLPVPSVGQSLDQAHARQKAQSCRRISSSR